MSFCVHKKFESAKEAAEILLTSEMLSKTDCASDFELEEIVAAKGKQILRYCCALLRDYHEAQDVTQTTFLKALSKRDGIKSELVPWLYRTAYNHCVDILRKRKWQRFLFTEERDGNASYEMQDGMSEEIREALGVLSPKDRALIICRALDDMGYDELSRIFKASAATLRKRYERSKKKLAQALREQGLEVTNGKA